MIPLDSVVECVELTPADRANLKEDGYINLRGSILPLVNLGEFFGHKNDKTKRENIIVVKFAEEKIGLVVEELQGEFQTVIKPLGKIFRKVKGISGATILGSGAVALILDVLSLVSWAIKNSESKKT